MPLAPDQAYLEAAVARLTRWLIGLAIVGTIIALVWRGPRIAGGFLLGALAAWVNLRLLERAVDRIGQLAASGNTKVRPRERGVLVLFQLAALLAGAFVILRLSGFTIVSALCGFLVCPAAVLVEIVYELLTYA